MSELVEFIRGCLDADEQTARAEPPHSFGGSPRLGWVDVGPGSALLTHPARVLAEVNAKRAILDMHAQSQHPLRGWTNCKHCGAGPGDCRTLRLLAQPYAGEPGWRDEWGTQ